MNIRSIGAWLLVCAALLAGAVRVHATMDADILKLQEQWRAAFGATDAAALDTIYADQLVYVHSDARIQTKQELTAPMRSGQMKFQSFKGCDEPRVRAYDHAAIVSACYELQGGRGPASRHLFMTTWTEIGGKWRIIAQQTTKLPDKP